jgi:beta-glucanase (GH16 family)
MKISSFIIFIILCRILHGQTPANDPNWETLWVDDFNYFDTDRWVKAHYGDHGGEPQLYLENNVSILDGNLVIKVKNTPAFCPQNPPYPTTWACGSCNQGIHEYTSGWVETKYPYNTKFGYIEGKIKLPYGFGFWPAFWTWRGDNVQTINEAEIDIFEMLGGSIPNSNTITSNIHTYYPDNNIYFEKQIPTNFD